MRAIVHTKLVQFQLQHNIHSGYNLRLHENNKAPIIKPAELDIVIFTARRSYASTVLAVVILSVSLALWLSVRHTRAL